MAKMLKMRRDAQDQANRYAHHKQPAKSRRKDTQILLGDAQQPKASRFSKSANIKENAEGARYAARLR
jgi:hypothetical protein